jgi:hypothetical protein
VIGDEPVVTKTPLRALYCRRRAIIATAVTAALTSALFSPGTATAQSVISPSKITIANGAVCTGASSGQTFPASITLPTPFVNDDVDVALLLDDTGSFSGEWSAVASTFSSVVDQLQAEAPGVTFGFGVSMFKDYGGAWTAVDDDIPETRPFILNQPIVTAATAGGESALDTLISNAVGLADELPGSGGDTPEASLEGLYQLATGAGFDGNGNGSTLDSGPAGALTTQEDPGDSGDVPPFSSNVATTSGSLGGIGWRPGALHIGIIATDTSPAAAFPAGAPIPATITSANGDSEPSINFAYSSLTPGDNRTGYVANSTDPATNTVEGAVVPEGGATVQGTVNALNSLGIRVLGMGPGDAPTTAEGPGGNSSSIWLSSMARLTGATDSSGNALVFDTNVTPTDLATSIVNNITTSAKNAVNVEMTASGAPSGLTVSFAPKVDDDVAPGGTADFDVTIKSNGAASNNGTFNLNFVDAGSGSVLGTLPVTVDCSSGQATSISTKLSGGDQTGASITVPSGTAVTDTAVLTGSKATMATGTVAYDVYNNSTCTSLALTGTAQTITTPGKLPSSASVTLATPGTYYWQASYSGDTNNSPSTSTCGTGGEVQTVTAAPTSLQLHISMPYQDNGVTVVSLWWTAPPGATTFTLTANENTGLGPYNYPDTGLPQFTQDSPFIIQVEGATPLFSATFQVTDNLGDVSNTVSYP